MDPNQPSIDESLEDSQRRQFEKAILVAVIAVPILLGVIINGFGYRIVDALVNFFVGVDSRLMQMAMQALTATTLLLSWRHPLLGKKWWKPTAILLATILIPTIFHAASDLWRDPTQSLARWFWENLIEVLQWASVLTGSLMLFVLIRRTTGICLIRKSTATIPVRKPLSIAELLGWITACAIMLAVIPVIVGATPWNYAGSISAYYVHLAFQVSVTTLSVLSVVATASWRWMVRIPVAFAAIFLLHQVEPFAYSIFYSISIDFLLGENWVVTPMVSAGAIALVAWAMERRGYQYVRLRRKASVA